MSRDLNLKKSWHPGLLKNQEIVWKREQEALEERKKIAERQKEIAKEREHNELLALQDHSTGKKRTKRLDWMYMDVSAGSGPGGAVADDAEAYLLGKKRIDVKSIQGKGDMEGLNEGSQRFMNVIHGTTGRGGREGGVEDKEVTDRAKLTEDPLAVIERVRAESMGGGRPSDRDVDRRSHRSSHRSEHRSEHRSDRSHRSSRRSSHRTSHRSSHGHSESKSRSPDRDRPRRDYNYKREESSSDRYRDRDNNRDSRISRDSETDREPRSGEQAQGKVPAHKSRDSQYTSQSRPSSYNPRNDPKAQENVDKARRLEDMISAAKSLDEERDQRLNAMAAKEKAEKEHDEAHRKKSQKLGGRGQFIRDSSIL